MNEIRTAIPPSTHPEGAIMAKVSYSKSEAASLLKAVGFLIADKWEADKLRDKLASLDKVEGIEEKVAGIEDESVQKLGQKTLAACVRGDVKFVVTDGAGGAESPAPSEGKPVEENVKKSVATKKPTKPVAAEAKGKPTKPVKPVGKSQAGAPNAKGGSPAAAGPAKPKKEGAAKDVDAWGNKNGTRTARINAALMSGKPLTTEELETKADAHGIHSHLTVLKNRGFIEKTADKKYVATKKGMAAKEAKKASKAK